MIAIGDVLVSDDVVKKDFVCNLSACKGACCWEGDFGAPVTKVEQETILELLPVITPQLSLESKALLEEKGAFAQYDTPAFTGTTLHSDGSCVFMTFDEGGTAKCGIEKTQEMGLIDYKKPLSCHMYPIRVIKNENNGFEAWNYDSWDICSSACTLGEKLKVPVFKFLKNAIIRLKGEDFYHQLEATAEHMASRKSDNP